MGFMKTLKDSGIVDSNATESANSYCHTRQVVLKEAFFGLSSTNTAEISVIVNEEHDNGYELSQMSTTYMSSKGIGGGDRTLVTMIFLKDKKSK